MTRKSESIRYNTGTGIYRTSDKNGTMSGTVSRTLILEGCARKILMPKIEGKNCVFIPSFSIFKII